MLFSCLLAEIYIRKAVRFLSKQGHLQPHFHSGLIDYQWSKGMTKATFETSALVSLHGGNKTLISLFDTKFSGFTSPFWYSHKWHLQETPNVELNPLFRYHLLLLIKCNFWKRRLLQRLLRGDFTASSWHPFEKRLQNYTMMKPYQVFKISTRTRSDKLWLFHIFFTFPWEWFHDDMEILAFKI